MTTRRIYSDAGRLIVSKPGFEADPGMSEDGKALDSDWGFTGTLIAAGRYLDPAAPYNGDATRTLTADPRVIVLPRPFRTRELMVVCATDRLPTRTVSYYAGGWGTREQAGVFFDDLVFAIRDGNLLSARQQVGSNPAVYTRMAAGCAYQVYSL